MMRIRKPSSAPNVMQLLTAKVILRMSYTSRGSKRHNFCNFSALLKRHILAQHLVTSKNGTNNEAANGQPHPKGTKVPSNPWRLVC